MERWAASTKTHYYVWLNLITLCDIRAWCYQHQGHGPNFQGMHESIQFIPLMQIWVTLDVNISKMYKCNFYVKMYVKSIVSSIVQTSEYLLICFHNKGCNDTRLYTLPVKRFGVSIYLFERNVYFQQGCIKLTMNVIIYISNKCCSVYFFFIH